MNERGYIMKVNPELKEKYGPKIIAQVIRILDEHTVIINAGVGKVHIGELLQIYEYLGDLIGPDEKNYGSFEYVKGEVEVVRIEPSYSVCKTEKVTGPSVSLALSPLLERPVSRRSSLPLDKEDISPLKPQDNKVRVGDPVKRA
jgi:hypothetical protein